MVSRKYPVGTMVYYVSAGIRRYGEVMNFEDAQREERDWALKSTAEDRYVWCHWFEAGMQSRNETHIGYMPEKIVYCDEPMIKRKLPKWF